MVYRSGLISEKTFFEILFEESFVFETPTLLLISMLTSFNGLQSEKINPSTMKKLETNIKLLLNSDMFELFSLFV